jgi:hypothetical protein
MLILAGMNATDNPHEIFHYFDASLRELRIVPPMKHVAAKTLLTYYLTEMIASPNDAYGIMQTVNNQIYNSTDWKKVLRLNLLEYHV